MKKLYLFIAMLTSTQLGFAQTITWSEDIACIIYTHCSSCHNTTDALAAFPLLSYSDAYGQRFAIQIFTQDRSMPPYLPNTNYRHYADEKNLTEQEINLIDAWVDQGAQHGDSTLDPMPPVINTISSTITNPDFSQRIPDHIVPPSGEEEFRCFVMGTPSTTEQYISAIEVLPGNLSAVHHVLVYSDTSSIPLTLDASDPVEGYEYFGGIGSHSAKLLYGWVHSTSAYALPANMRLRLEANAHLVIQIVYAEDAGNKLDSTRLNVKFDNGLVRPVDVLSLLDDSLSLQNGPLFIPADSIKTFYESAIFPFDATFLSIAPHAHHLCMSMKVYGVTPANDTIPFLDISDWGVLWQEGPYPFSQLVKIPAGTVLYGEATFDNTYMNDMNPNDPPQNVNGGDEKTDEGLMFYFSYLPYQTDDENIVVDSTPHMTHYLNCSTTHTVSVVNLYERKVSTLIYPNPSYEIANVQLLNSYTGDVKYLLTNLLGQIRKASVVSSQNGTIHLDVSELSAGTYFLQLNRGTDTNIYKLVKQ